MKKQKQKRQLWDFFSDILFSREIFYTWQNTEYADPTYLWLFLFSLACIGIPYGMNLRQVTSDTAKIDEIIKQNLRAKMTVFFSSFL